jgi:hypothetical protein
VLPLGCSQDAPQQWCGDAKGDVRDQVGAGAEVDREHVAVDHVDAITQAGLQPHRPAMIELDGSHGTAESDESFGEGAGAGPELEDRGIVRPGRDDRDDGVDHRRVDEEVLAELVSAIGSGQGRLLRRSRTTQVSARQRV